MKNIKALTHRSLAVGLVILILTVTASFALGTRIGLANGTPDTSQMVSAGSPPPLTEQFAGSQPQVRPGALSNQLSYYFISGNTFTPSGNVAYSRQVNGCVNQMPIGIPFSAPVNLPNGSQVVSITAYTWNNAADAAISTAYFIINDSTGFGGYTISAASQPYTTGYQQFTSTDVNPFTVDNQNYNLLVEWRKNLGTADSPLLSLCGVRVAYYAPLGSLYLPTIVK